jgi:hypothetical protein
MVSMQRFTGKLGGHHGTFVLQGKEIVENGKIKATWFVVPGSGTGSLPGCEARAALKATLEKGQTDGWIIGSNEALDGARTKADQISTWNAIVVCV